MAFFMAVPVLVEGLTAALEDTRQKLGIYTGTGLLGGPGSMTPLLGQGD